MEHTFIYISFYSLTSVPRNSCGADKSKAVQTDRQSDPYVVLCFVGTTKIAKIIASEKHP